MKEILRLVADGVPSAPINFVGSATTPTSITLTWEQLGGPDVDGYEINYRYIISECGDLRDPPAITLPNSSQRSYTIENGADTPVEEDSDYQISLIAINSVGNSSEAPVQVTTPEAGTVYTCYMCIYLIVYIIML